MIYHTTYFKILLYAIFFLLYIYIQCVVIFINMFFNHHRTWLFGDTHRDCLPVNSHGLFQVEGDEVTWPDSFSEFRVWFCGIHLPELWLFSVILKMTYIS